MIERLRITLTILWHVFECQIEWDKRPYHLVETQPDYDHEQIENLLTDVKFANRVNQLELEDVS